VNTENLSTASVKAIEAGGTNNVLIGRALVKRDVFEETENGIFRFMPTAEYLNSVMPAAPTADEIDAEKAYAEQIEREENAADDGSHERWELAQAEKADRHMEIEALSDEFMTCDAERAEEITARLAELGAEVPVLPMDAHTKQIVNPALTAEQSFAVAIRNDDLDAAREILGNAAPAVRDPRETRYAQIERWTDDNLEVKYGILSRRIMRRTLLKADRMQAERQCQIVENELLRRGIKPNRNV